MFPFDDSLTFDEIQDITRHESERVIAVTGGKVLLELGTGLEEAPKSIS